MEKFNQSIYDSLIKLLPDMQNRIIKGKDHVNPVAARSLFSIWRIGNNKIDKNTYKRPPTVSYADVQMMQKEGLIRSIGDRIEITEKGSKVLKIMILGDDRSSFEEDNIVNKVPKELKENLWIYKKEEIP